MLFILVFWMIINQLLNTFYGLKSILVYFLGVFILAGLNDFQIINIGQLLITAVTVIILIFLLLILIKVRNKYWGINTLPVQNLILSGVSSGLLLGSLLKPAIGLLMGTALLSLPFGNIIRSKGILGIIKLYLVAIIQWWGLLLINLVVLWMIL